MVKVHLPQASWGHPAGTYDVRIPAGVTGAKGTDGELVVVDGTTVHNFWQFKRTSSTTATVSAYGKADVKRDSGWGSRNPTRGAGITATGASQLAGLLVEAELKRGEVRHALQLVIDQRHNENVLAGEAIHADGAWQNQNPRPELVLREGQRLAIPAGAKMPVNLSPYGKKVFRALQKYGAFDVDSTDRLCGLRVQSNAFNASKITRLRNDMKSLIPMLQKVN